MKKVKVSAPGKIHLLGEHAVVYGKPAIIAAVDKRIFVEIESSKNKDLDIVLKEINDDKLFSYVKYAVDTTLKFYNKSLPSGIKIMISSEIPIGSGMGSSAASAVAIAGAVTLFLGQKFDKDKINEIAFSIEKYNHGNPSGGDNSASCYGGLIWYQKKSADEKVIKKLSLKLSDKIVKNFFLVNTGKPKESTGEMVSLVKKFVDRNQKLAKEIFADQEMLTKNLLLVLKKGNEKEIIRIIKDGEKNLEKLGTVSSYVKKIIRKIEGSGGAAKICGAGGKIKEAGMVLVYHKNGDVLTNLLKQYNLSCSNIAFSSEGAKMH